MKGGAASTALAREGAWTIIEHTAGNGATSPSGGPSLWFRIDDEPGEGLKEARIIDLSPAGMGVITPVQLIPGQILHFDQQEAVGLCLYPARGMVVWAIYEQEGVRAGIRFF